MNNIEILEELKARLKLYKKSTDVQFTFTKSDIQAIENLIKENKKLKEERKLIDKMFIGKAKVREKIEHYKELLQDYIKQYDETNQGLEGMINVLQELLEE